MFDQCWANVEDVGQTLVNHWVDMSRLLGTRRMVCGQFLPLCSSPERVHWLKDRLANHRIHCRINANLACLTNSIKRRGMCDTRLRCGFVASAAAQSLFCCSEALQPAPDRGQMSGQRWASVLTLAQRWPGIGSACVVPWINQVFVLASGCVYFHWCCSGREEGYPQQTQTCVLPVQRWHAPTYTPHPDTCNPLMAGSQLFITLSFLKLKLRCCYMLLHSTIILKRSKTWKIECR